MLSCLASAQVTHGKWLPPRIHRRFLCTIKSNIKVYLIPSQLEISAGRQDKEYSHEFDEEAAECEDFECSNWKSNHGRCERLLMSETRPATWFRARKMQNRSGHQNMEQKLQNRRVAMRSPLVNLGSVLTGLAEVLPAFFKLSANWSIPFHLE